MTAQKEPAPGRARARLFSFRARDLAVARRRRDALLFPPVGRHFHSDRSALAVL
jgi:hypothetical protein